MSSDIFSLQRGNYVLLYLYSIFYRWSYRKIFDKKYDTNCGKNEYYYYYTPLLPHKCLCIIRRIYHIYTIYDKLWKRIKSDKTRHYNISSWFSSFPSWYYFSILNYDTPFGMANPYIIYMTIGGYFIENLG